MPDSTTATPIPAPIPQASRLLGYCVVMPKGVDTKDFRLEWACVFGEMPLLIIRDFNQPVTITPIYSPGETNNA